MTWTPSFSSQELFLGKLSCNSGEPMFFFPSSLQFWQPGELSRRKEESRDDLPSPAMVLSSWGRSHWWAAYCGDAVWVSYGKFLPWKVNDVQCCLRTSNFEPVVCRDRGLLLKAPVSHAGISAANATLWNSATWKCLFADFCSAKSLVTFKVNGVGMCIAWAFYGTLSTKLLFNELNMGSFQILWEINGIIEVSS